MSSSLQILVIDDEPAIRQILAASLTRAGHTVETAASGREGLMRLSKGDVEVALCDINMPDLTGIEVVREAGKSGYDTTFIMMTAFSSVDTAVEAMKAGATDYMIKPLRSEELLQRLAQIADLRGLGGEDEALLKLVGSRSDDRIYAVSPAMTQLER